MKQDRRGVVYVETLIAFLPVITFFFGTLHVADVSVAHLVVDHAATVAARAAVVVLPDDGAYYGDPSNDLLHLFKGERRDDVEAAADYVMGVNPRLDNAGENVALDKVEYTYRDQLTAQVTARYTCLITMFCGDGFDITGKADLVYQGADYTYEPHGAGIDNLVASIPSRRDRRNRPDEPPYPDADPGPPPSTQPTGQDQGADDDRTPPPPDNDRRPTGQDGEGDNTNRGPPQDGQPGSSSGDTPSGPDSTGSDTLPDDAIAAIGPGTKPAQEPGMPACTGAGCRRQPGEEGACFVAGTLISTPDGARPIETIAAGDDVYAYDTERREVVVRRVPQTTIRQSDRVIDLQVRYLDSGRRRVISGTPEHPFYVPARAEYLPLGALPQHAVLRTVEYGDARVESARVRYGDFQVFNFEVEDEHNYFVAAPASEEPGVLVHNQTRHNCGPAPPGRDVMPYDPQVAAEAHGEPIIDPTTPRRSPRDSENEINAALRVEEEQPSYRDGKPAGYGERRSSRPDGRPFSSTDHFIEIKNYDLSKSSRRADLYNALKKQAEEREKNLPQGATQAVIIDAEGLAIPQQYQMKIPLNIENATGGRIRAENIWFTDRRGESARFWRPWKPKQQQSN